MLDKVRVRERNTFLHFHGDTPPTSPRRACSVSSRRGNIEESYVFSIGAVSQELERVIALRSSGLRPFNDFSQRVVEVAFRSPQVAHPLPGKDIPLTPEIYPIVPQQGGHYQQPDMNMNIHPCNGGFPVPRNAKVFLSGEKGPIPLEQPHYPHECMYHNNFLTADMQVNTGQFPVHKPDLEVSSQHTNDTTMASDNMEMQMMSTSQHFGYGDFMSMHMNGMVYQDPMSYGMQQYCDIWGSPGMAEWMPIDDTHGEWQQYRG